MTEPRDPAAPLESEPAGTRSDFEVQLLIDGEPVSLKPFLHDMIGGAVTGLVSGLRGVEDPDAVEIRVRRL